MKILIINGPNLNLLGKREEKHYGKKTLSDIETMLGKKAKELHVHLLFYQSNHEGDLIDFIQKNAGKANGIVINAGALTHYGYSLRDCLGDTTLPIISVHLSEVKKREQFRKINILKDIVIAEITGLKERSYIIGLERLVSHIRENI